MPSTLRIEDLQAELAQASGLRACAEDVWRLFGLSLAAYNVVVQVTLACRLFGRPAVGVTQHRLGPS